jgi:hypothetical protein
MEVADSSGYVEERIMKNPKEDTRWGEICQKIRIDQHLDKGMERQLWCVLEQYQDVFAWNKGELGCCNVGEHQIDTQGFPPCKVAPSRLSYWEEVEVNMQINVLVELGKMRPSNSAYACRVTLPVKKDGSRRFCGDYRPLNLQTRRDSFPMPLVEDIISQLGKSAWFTALDLQSGFWQIKMAPEDVGKTELVTKSGLFEWTVMPFGLKNATSTFTRTMTEVFKGFGDSFLKIFVDDLNVHSEEWQDHLQHLGAVLSRLREVNLKLNPSKCCFAAGSVVFLGHVVSKEGTRPDPSKVDAVRGFPVPTTVTNVRSFLGLTGYYRKYIKGYSKLAGLLFELTKKDVVFVWNQDCQKAFADLKKALMGAPILVRPNFKEPFCLDVDWSTKGVGAILSQREGRFERVIAYASKALTLAQRKFHPMEGECYALVWGVLHFRQYLHRTHFTLRTDHKPLEWLATVSDAHGRRGRWIDLLQDYSFKIVHKLGMRHANADALSRNPVGKAMDDEDFQQEIQDDPHTQPEVAETIEKVLAVRYGQHMEWLGNRRQLWGHTERQGHSHGTKHWHDSDPHHMFMIDLVITTDSKEEATPSAEQMEVTEHENLEVDHGELRHWKGQTKYYDRRQQLELVLVAQGLSEIKGREIDPTTVGEEVKYGVEVKEPDI